MKIVHEPEHKPEGDPCAKCGLAASRHVHRVRKRKRVDHRKGSRRSEAAKKKRHLASELAREKRNSEPLVGIDGEGEGRNPHLYTYLSAVDETGKKLGSVSNRNGLLTLECLYFLCDLADQGIDRVFGYSLGYDFSMMLQDLPDKQLYELVRPDLRTFIHPQTGKTMHRPIYWRGFKLSYLRRKLGVQRVAWDAQKKKYLAVSKPIVVWDVFAFYQGKFTKALKDWKIASKEAIAEIAKMKDKRSEFDRMGQCEIQAYCDKECEYLAKLVRQLIEAHETARLPLRSFYGAGSTASALLTRMGIKNYLAEPPPEMVGAVGRGFFGGRFEVSRCGVIEEPCWNHDISSAYPYELWQLPCLSHGKWRLRTGSEKEIDRAIRGARLALVHAEVKGSGPGCWGPLPFRIRDGSIMFPRKSEGTWVWRDEYLSARDSLWPGVTPLDAWCYETPCDCQPFKELSEIYIERCAIGKDGPGIVLKLGPNSVYGKLAQSEGSAPFQSWILAGCVTSGTRAQLLRAIAKAKRPENILMLATDGILATERLELEIPRDTGTWDAEVEETGKDGKIVKVKKPLGGWEVKEKPNGIFLARPGIYWTLGATKEELADTKARGISRAVLWERAAHIEKHFRSWRKNIAEHPYKVVGQCLSCVWKARRGSYVGETGGEDKCPACGAKAAGPCVRFIGTRQGIGKAAKKAITRRDNYGEWEEWPLELGFHAPPKRVQIRADGSLECWERPPGGGQSAIYKKAQLGADAQAAKIYEEMREEQPDCDLTMA